MTTENLLGHPCIEMTLESHEDLEPIVCALLEMDADSATLSATGVIGGMYRITLLLEFTEIMSAIDICSKYSRLHVSYEVLL